MFGWVSRCWGGLGVKSIFERARIRSIITDWKVPDDQDIYVILTTFKGQNIQISAENAIQFFLKQMQTDYERNNPIFLLKHLFILDHATQSLLLLHQISQYQNTQFFNYKTGKNIDITPIRQLVGAYFLYIKKKSSIYLRLDHNIITKKDDRINIIQKYTNSQIFSLIDKCFEIQKHINEINIKFKGQNKSIQLIQMVFAMLLKTYLFCYTIISTSVRIFFKRLLKMSKNEAVKMQKFITYFNKEYTRNFVDFIQSNKEIEIYKTIKYSELILIDKSYVQYLQNHITNISNKPASLIQEEIVNVDEEDKIQFLPQQILNKISQELRINYQPKKTIKLRQTNKNAQNFHKFINLYSNDYDSQYQSSMRYNYNLELDNNRGSLNQSKMFKSKILSYQNQENIYKFNEAMWNQCKNVYSS